MHLPLIKIGNSKGIRLGKALLEQYQIHESIELILEPDYIILKPVSQPEKPRQGWSQAFKKMHQNGDDRLFMGDVFDDEDWA